MGAPYHCKVLIVGGGAGGMFAAARLAQAGKGGDVCIAERGGRLGRKLSVTGNGQGNVTNSDVSAAHFRSGRPGFFLPALRAFPFSAAEEFYAALGIFLTMEEGRKYPLSRQASSVTDALRAFLERSGVRAETDFRAVRAAFSGGRFRVFAEDGREIDAEKLVFAFGGKAAKQFGTDGSAYALAEGFGHKITPLYPSLVQLKTETEPIRGLKGIRAPARVKAEGRYCAEAEGDVLFTDYGVSGSAAFAVSGAVSGGGRLEIEFLPELGEKELLSYLRRREKLSLPLTGGLLHNQLGRMLEKRADGAEKLAALIKRFPLRATGSAGFDAAQVTAGGVDTETIDPHTMESLLQKGLYIVGEALDVDGDCGGYNLHWALASAAAAARAIAEEV